MDCQVCGKAKGLHRHHWKGYQYPKETWLVCRQCNRRLMGRHDGSLDLEAARRFVETPRFWGHRLFPKLIPVEFIVPIPASQCPYKYADDCTSCRVHGCARSAYNRQDRAAVSVTYAIAAGG